MGKINSILDQRMKQGANTSKMNAMAQQSASGNLTSFSGVFRVADLHAYEKENLEDILKQYAQGQEENIQEDLEKLVALTSEVKAINNQAALLHGERIKRAHEILISYREGAFTAWLMVTYGNRQTPYNFLQYFEFCEGMPKQLRPQIEMMPRQAVYALASREGNIEKKRAVVENYKGETKIEMLNLIRELFPLQNFDKRKQNIGKTVISNLRSIHSNIGNVFNQMSKEQKTEVKKIVHELESWLSSQQDDQL